MRSTSRCRGRESLRRRRSAASLAWYTLHVLNLRDMRKDNHARGSPMRAAIFRNGEIVVDTLPEPKPVAGQVLVKTLACGICGSDLHARKHAPRMVDMARQFARRKAV